MAQLRFCHLLDEAKEWNSSVDRNKYKQLKHSAVNIHPHLHSRVADSWLFVQLSTVTLGFVSKKKKAELILIWSGCIALHPVRVLGWFFSQTQDPHCRDIFVLSSLSNYADEFIVLKTKLKRSHRPVPSALIETLDRLLILLCFQITIPYLQIYTSFDVLMYISLRALYFFPRPLEFPGLLCDIRGVERSRAGPCVTEWVTNTNANVPVS